MLRRLLFLILLVPQQKRNGINTWSVPAMLLQEDYMTYTDNTLVQFTTLHHGTYVDMEDGDTGTFTYSYSLTDSGANTGKITISSEWKNEDDTEYTR